MTHARAPMNVRGQLLQVNKKPRW